MTNLVNLKLEDFEKFDFNGICCPCKILHIYDGDTTIIGINWNNRYIKLRLRLKGINSAEIKPKKNIKNRDSIIETAYLAKKKLIEYCTNRCPENCKSKEECEDIMKNNTKILHVKLYHFDNFGRVIGELYLDSEYKDCINTLMVDNGYAMKFSKYK